MARCTKRWYMFPICSFQEVETRQARVERKDKLLMNKELERVWKGAAVT
jgi:hypothetical protein